MAKVWEDFDMIKRFKEEFKKKYFDIELCNEILDNLDNKEIKELYNSYYYFLADMRETNHSMDYNHMKLFLDRDINPDTSCFIANKGLYIYHRMGSGMNYQIKETLKYINNGCRKPTPDNKIMLESSNTLLQGAVDIENIDMIKLLIKYKSDINQCNKYGITPLMKAVSNKSYDIIKLLIDNKADKYIKDEYGRTAIYYAVIQNDLNLYKFFQEYNGCYKYM